MTTLDAEPEIAEPGTAGPPRDATPGGEITVALTPQQLAFLAVIAGVILAVVRRVVGRTRRRRGAGGDAATGEG